MPYATPAEFRARFCPPGSSSDEFAAYTDAQLALALEAGELIINAWIGVQQNLPDWVLDVLREYCIRLARRSIYSNQALDREHPVIRDAEAAMEWLKAVSKGAVPGVIGSVPAAEIQGGVRNLPDITSYSSIIR